VETALGRKPRHAAAALLALAALAPGRAQGAGGAKAQDPRPAQTQQKPAQKTAQAPAQKPKQAQAPRSEQAQAPRSEQAQAPKPTQSAQAPRPAQVQAPKAAQDQAPKPAQAAQAPKPAKAAAPKPAQAAPGPKPAQTAPAPKPAQTQGPKPTQAAQDPKPAQAAPAPKPAQAQAPRPAQGAKGAAKRPARKPAKKAAPKPAPPPLPAFQENPAVLEFIARMAAKHGFDADALMGLFSAISPNARVLSLLRPAPPRPPTPPQPRQTPPKPAVRSWKKYSAVFLNESRVEGGVRFWRENAATLERAHRQYGVPPEIIVAIIGVETLYGERKGGFCVLEALASLAFHDPARGDFFTEELEHFLLLSRENGFDPLAPQGSYAGAIGIPQFMPGSWRRFAVDYDGDGRTDLDSSFADSIGSVANYLNRHGWKRDEPVAHRASLAAAPDPAWAQAGMLPSLSVKGLKAGGVAVGQENAPATATFIELPTPRMPTEYWLGYGNYYAITRYNRSHYYSMSVFLLAEEIRARAGR
jgi:membrane-bound lytic murein transglycosylase B